MMIMFSVFVAHREAPPPCARWGWGYNDIKSSGESGSTFGGYREQGRRGGEEGEGNYGGRGRVVCGGWLMREVLLCLVL